ncbi:MAG: ammonium transporter [Rhodobacteraceae bacterium]|nr:ammonium transporter [Paracoccaceae bacterium]
MNAADTAWIMTSTVLVLFMTLPGLALFYGGLVRSRNVLSVLMHTMAIACLMSILWLMFGYSIAFGDGGALNAYWGGLGKVFLTGVTADSMTGTIPEIVFFAFQMTFAIITPALIVGAYVERVGFGFVLTFSGLWMLIVYSPVVHWVWAAGGWALELGTVDLAGGIVVHETAGLAALVVAFFLGPRKDKSKPPHNPGYVMLGAAMLWVGWFGFNAGSHLSVSGDAGMTMVVTHISAATASLSWAAWERIKYGKSSMVGLVTGTIAGLAAITPASGSVTPMEAMLIGAIAGVLTQEMCGLIKNHLKIDDTLDVFAVHGVGGIFGTLMIAVFGGATWAAQLTTLGVVAVYTIVVSTVIVLLVKLIFPIRVSEEDEFTGLDIASHGERAYDHSS